jgi:hypothetical protein
VVTPLELLAIYQLDGGIVGNRNEAQGTRSLAPIQPKSAFLPLRKPHNYRYCGDTPAFSIIWRMIGNSS